MALDNQDHSRTRLRNCAFSIVTIILFFVLLEMILLLFKVQPVLVSEDPYVGFSSLIPLYVEKRVDNKQVYITAKNKLGVFNRQSFPLEKNADSYRIFCMGGSTTYGRPYDYRTSFCGWLEAFLKVTEPERDWQVINAGGISYASYRVTALMEELASFQPDLFIIYSGHNEFLEERTYRELTKLPKILTETNALLAHTRIYSVIKTIVGDTSPPPYELKAEVDERLAHTVGPEDYHRNDTLRDEIIAHYQLNIGRMKEIADAAGSQIIYINPARNLKDQSPFKSEHDASLSKKQHAKWQQWTDQGKYLLNQNSPEKALQWLDQSAKLDNRHAELLYLRGKALFSLGRYPEARSSFDSAADEDIAPLRILSEMQVALLETVPKLDAPLIDYAQLLETHNQNREGHNITGQEWFLDHVHPTLEGHRELALAIYKQMLAQGLTSPEIELDSKQIAQISDRIIGSITPERERSALHNISQVLGWAGQLEEAHSILMRLLVERGDDESTLFKLGRSSERLGNPDEAIGFYQRAVEIAPESNEARVFLAKMLREQGQYDDAIVHFAKSTEIAPTYKYSFYSLAELHAEKGENEKSIIVYRELLQQFPEDKLSTLNLGILLLDMGELSEAESLFSHLCNEEITIGDACVGLAQIAEQKGQLQETVRWYRWAIDRKQGNAVMHNGLAIVLSRQGLLDLAIDHFRKALEIEPEFRAARQNLSTALMEKEKQREQ